VSAPRVDVVILTWNDGPLLDAAVSSALRSEGVDVRVFVVDNGSDPPAQAPLDDRGSLLRNRVNRGVAAGRNQGAGAGASPYVLFLDSDARLLPSTLRLLVEPMERRADVAVTAPVFRGQPPEASAGRSPSLADKAVRVLGLRSVYRPMAASGPYWDVDFAIGACQLVRRHAFDMVGGFDESYFYGPEDVDLCLRLRRQGLRVLQVRSAECEHPPRRRNRRLFTRRGLQHGWAVTRHLWRHRDSRRLAA
jgi:GT2 family glycosyltransferase